MNADQWRELQRQVGDLALLPDYPLRPSSVGLVADLEGIGHIYNIHPGCSGSVLDAIRLAHRIRARDGKLMIGDDSLIGPACTIWQQLAIGLEAEWVESLEKPQESDLFLSCIKRQATTLKDGKVRLEQALPGFGIELDEERLASLAQVHVNVFVSLMRNREEG